MAVVFGSSYAVTIVRGRGTPDEKTWDTYMGGDLGRKALFQPEDRLKVGDEIHCEIFDEPKIATNVDPEMTFSGLSFWKVEMMPESRWKAQQRAAHPTIHVTGQGSRVNIGSTDNSSQHFYNHHGDQAAVLRALDVVSQAIQQNVGSPEEQGDAAIDVEQIRTELRRSKPEQSRIWALVERLNSLAGLAGKVAPLIGALEHFFGSKSS